MDFNLEDSLLATSTAGLLGDWAQTRYIRDSDEYHEGNPILGPDAKYADVYFPAMIAGNYFLGKNIDPFYRKILWGIVSAVQAKQIHDNYQIGIGFKF